MEVLIADKYRVGRKIGCGSFGDIYIGILSTIFFPFSVTENYFFIFF